jgi:hypothetical protein
MNIKRNGPCTGTNKNLLEIVPSQVMILYEGNALEVGVTSRLLCYVARIVRMYDGAVIYIHPTNPALA